MRFNKTILAIFLVAVFSGAAFGTHHYHNKQTTSSSSMDCFISVAKNINTLASDPIGILMELNACYGDSTWNYVAPFIGGYVRPAAYMVYTNMAADASGNKAMTELELYNFMMKMVKEAVGEILGYPASSDAFAYVDSVTSA